MVFETVQRYLAQCLGCGEARIREQTAILEDLEATEEDLAEVLMGLEEEFDLSFPEDAAESFRTVGQLVSWIESQE